MLAGALPHVIAMMIGGYCPHMMHGEALAVIYPEFARATHPHAVRQFAVLGLNFGPAVVAEPDEVVLVANSSQVLRDYRNSPRAATRDEIYRMLERSYRR
jgi:hypothetical protein